MKRWALTLLFGMLTLAAFAAPAVDYEVELYKAHYTVNPDGTYEAQIQVVKRLLTPNGVQEEAQAAMPYSEKLETLEVVEAYTLKKDGSKVTVPKDRIFVQAPPETQDAPTFSDNKVVKVVFPQVGVGDAVSVTWKLVQKEPYFPGHFYVTDLEPIDEVVKRAETTVDAPASMKLFWKKRGGPELGDYVVKEETKDGRQRITATFSRSEPIPLEPGMVDAAQVSPAFTVTTFPSWEAIGAAYWARAKDKAEVTPAIQKLADEVAGDAEGLDAAKKLYAWVEKNVRYVGLELGIGGYVPQSAEQVLNQRYGDCKGYVTLLQALLAAKGVRSRPVLIHLGEDYGLLPAPTPDQFNHAILYLPDHGLYLDPTTRYAPFGVLVLGDLSKPVVITGEAPELSRTPAGDPKRDSYREVQTLTLAEDASLKGEAKIYTAGYVEAQWRIIFAGIPKVAFPQVLQSLLSRFAEGGSGTLEVTPPDDLDQPFVVQAQWQSPSLTPAGPTLNLGRVPTGFTILPFDQLRSYAAPEKRRFPVSMGAFTAEYHKTLRFPKGYQAKMLPKDASLENAAGSFEARFTPDGEELKVDIKLVLPKDVYPPEAYPDLRKLLNTTVAAINQPIVLEKKP